METPDGNFDTSPPMSKESTLMLDEKYIVNKRDLIIGKELGKGAFGVVHEGILNGDRVAVKKLRDIDSKHTHVAKILDEAHCMSEFHHPNVLPLIGVAVGDDGMPQLVTPFMDGGDLLSFLRTFSLSAQSPTKRLSLKTMLSFAKQVAMGMQYLSERSFIHRDLAARNCMLSKDLQVRVGDFGLARDVEEDSYYRVNTEWCLPVRWMALEGLQYHKFSPHSDMWSYGVLLFEIFTCGAVPYAGLANAEILSYLNAGHRLDQPKGCPDELYDLMLACWKQDAACRPAFSSILSRLGDYKVEFPSPLHTHQAEDVQRNGDPKDDGTSLAMVISKKSAKTRHNTYDMYDMPSDYQTRVTTEQRQHSRFNTGVSSTQDELVYENAPSAKDSTTTSVLASPLNSSHTSYCNFENTARYTNLPGSS
eukprot:scpid53354/ scgid22433/ Tyrosine-protein kinase receptor TYRO3; Tyrosine-protein kinase SKY